MLLHIDEEPPVGPEPKAVPRLLPLQSDIGHHRLRALPSLRRGDKAEVIGFSGIDSPPRFPSLTQDEGKRHHPIGRGRGLPAVVVLVGHDADVIHMDVPFLLELDAQLLDVGQIDPVPLRTEGLQGNAHPRPFRADAASFHVEQAHFGHAPLSTVVSQAEEHGHLGEETRIHTHHQLNGPLLIDPGQVLALVVLPQESHPDVPAPFRLVPLQVQVVLPGMAALLHGAEGPAGKVLQPEGRSPFRIREHLRVFKSRPHVRLGLHDIVQRHVLQLTAGDHQHERQKDSRQAHH